MKTSVRSLRGEWGAQRCGRCGEYFFTPPKPRPTWGQPTCFCAWCGWGTCEEPREADDPRPVALWETA